ncbi:ABC transporter permease [Paenibacillus swuensis]|uniref:ABC transporter permease n=1 Tax=Paenibacillus swuensis TaxID=1178515 RepID=A0A172TF55_9BACL|nr:carbohydrate ABC transporter permease [Paenibacillus swuensis]ANE45534.1 ABC transporter permease [Paenibacillus swuensis]
MRTKFSLFNSLNITLMVMICVVTIYPFLNTLAISLNDGADANRGGIYLWPRLFSTQSYEVIFKDDKIIQALIVTVSRTALGILTTVFCTAIFAYGLSKKMLIGRKYYLLICVIGLIFNGGLIPTYLLYKDLHLLDTFAVYIIPGLINIWYMLLMKTFFEQIPAELEEAAKIDGCGTWRLLFTIIFPLSMPIIASICIFVGVDQWNSWFDAYVFTYNENLQPIQTYLFKIIALNQTPAQDAMASQMLERARTTGRTLSAAAVIVTTLPIMFIYFLFQKHFTKGVMVGALKG